MRYISLCDSTHLYQFCLPLIKSVWHIPTFILKAQRVSVEAHQRNCGSWINWHPQYPKCLNLLLTSGDPYTETVSRSFCMFGVRIFWMWSSQCTHEAARLLDSLRYMWFCFVWFGAFFWYRHPSVVCVCKCFSCSFVLSLLISQSTQHGNVMVFFITERAEAWFRLVPSPSFLTELAEAGSGINYKCPDNMRWASRST